MLTTLFPASWVLGSPFPLLSKSSMMALSLFPLGSPLSTFTPQILSPVFLQGQGGQYLHSIV